MKKSILQSIHPIHCENIIIGIKGYELRKTKPNIPTPFKVYIYETKDKKYMNMAIYEPKKDIKFEHALGKVIAEYICDEIIEWAEDMCPPVPLSTICLSYRQIRKYGGNKTLYLWHISDLKIYDKPKELSEFTILCKEYDKDNPDCECCDYQSATCDCDTPPQFDCKCNGLKPLTRPPQSWCYVEEACIC